MQRFVRWLLDLERIDPQDAPDLSLQWLEPIDGWLWFILLTVVPAYVLLIYRHEGGSLRSRMIMAGGRAVVILFTLLLLGQPALVHRRDRIEPSTVAIMVDQSTSMTRWDQYSPEQWQGLARLLSADDPRHTVTRWQIAQQILSHVDRSSPEQRGLLANLLTKHELRLFGFAGSISAQHDILEVDDIAAARQQLIREHATGQETNIARSIEQVFDACIDAHLAGIVMLTDGQPTADVDWTRVTHLARIRGTPVFVIAIGSPEPPPDLAVRGVKADRHVYLGDRVAVECTVHEIGLEAGRHYDLRLRDALTNELYAAETLQSNGGESSRDVELQFNPRAIGLQKLVVEIPALEDELETANNVQQFRIEVVDDRIKVLYVDGYPRYEYRYLKNTLLREPSIISSILLLSADRNFPQEGDEPIRRFPRDDEELNEYDVILFGDVDPREGWISRIQMERIVDFVNHEGGGFGLIAGENYTPERFHGTPLERVIPIELSGRMAAEPQSGARSPFRPVLTAAGRDNALFRLLLDARQAEQAFRRLPPWYWCHLAPEAKPGTEVLLEHPSSTEQRHNLPLVVVGRHGAGRIFYQGSDDTWRWRRHRGEGFFDTYWIQVVRYLGRNKKLRSARTIALRTQSRKVERRTPVVISLEFEEAAHSAQLPDAVQATISNALGIKLVEVTLTRLTANSKRFQGSYLPTATGQLQVSFDPERYGLDFGQVSALVEVEQQSLEDRSPQANISLMTELAQKTGGNIVQPWEAASVHELIPERQYVIPDDITETIWDSKLAMALFALFIAVEWIVRRINGLA